MAGRRLQECTTIAAQSTDYVGGTLGCIYISPMSEGSEKICKVLARSARCYSQDVVMSLRVGSMIDIKNCDPRSPLHVFAVELLGIQWNWQFVGLFLVIPKYFQFAPVGKIVYHT